MFFSHIGSIDYSTFSKKYKFFVIVCETRIGQNKLGMLSFGEELDVRVCV